MSERDKQRRPATFRLDGANVVVVNPDDATRPARGTVQVTPEAEPVLLPLPVEPPAVPQRGWRWGTVFWTGLAGMALLGLGVGVTQFIEDLFARSEGLGVLGLAFAIAAGFALAVVTARELLSLAHLAAIERLNQRAAAVIVSDDRDESRAVVHDLIRIAHHNPQLARARAALEGHVHDIIDGADLIRQLAKLYGGRPGALGMIRLLRHIIAHLAMTGGMAASDGLVQQMLGHGLAAKLSQRLGEGVLNGLLTARLGLAAIEVTRPLPFTALPRPALTDLAKDLLRKRDDEE